MLRIGLIVSFFVFLGKVRQVLFQNAWEINAERTVVALRFYLIRGEAATESKLSEYTIYPISLKCDMAFHGGQAMVDGGSILFTLRPSIQRNKETTCKYLHTFIQPLRKDKKVMVDHLQSRGTQWRHWGNRVKVGGTLSKTDVVMLGSNRTKHGTSSKEDYTKDRGQGEV